MHPSQRRARALVLILASALALPLAGRGSAGPAPAPAGALSAVPTAGSLYKFVLKDGQEAQLRLVDYDRYFLTVSEEGDALDLDAIEAVLDGLADRPVRVTRVPR